MCMRTQQMREPGEDAGPELLPVTVIRSVIMLMLMVVPVPAGSARPPHRRKSHEAKDAPTRADATAWLVSSAMRSALIWAPADAPAAADAPT